MKKISEVSKLVGVSKRTLQYYDDEGLLVVERTKNNHRLYDRDDLEQIWKILIYKEMGFELGQIKQILALSLNQQKIYLEKKKEEIETRIAELNARTEIVTFVRQNGIPPAPVEHMAGITYVEYIRDMGKQIQNWREKLEEAAFTDVGGE